MRAVDILLLALATLIGLLTLALQPWTLQWWAAIIVAVIIALAALVHMIMSAKGVSVKMSTWAPWFLILGGPLAGFLWLYIATPATPSPQIAISIGSLRYVVFIADVVRDTISKQTSVQMIVEVKNGTDHLMFFHAKLNGNIDGKTSPNGPIQFDGNIPSGDTRRLPYDRIFSVPVNENANSENPVLSGSLDYDVKYWVEPTTPRIERRSAKTVQFSLWRPFAKEPPPGNQTELRTTVKLSNEIEE